MARKSVKQSPTSVTPERTPPTARLELENGIPEGLPQPGAFVRLVLEGTLLGSSLKEYPEDRDNIKVKIAKVTVSGKGKRKPTAPQDETKKDADYEA